MRVAFNMTGMSFILVAIHDKEHYFPSTSSFFGAHTEFFSRLVHNVVPYIRWPSLQNWPDIPRDLFQEVNATHCIQNQLINMIQRQKTVLLSKEGEECSADGHPGFIPCLEDYMQEKLGCQIIWAAKPRKVFSFEKCHQDLFHKGDCLDFGNLFLWPLNLLQPITCSLFCYF